MLKLCGDCFLYEVSEVLGDCLDIASLEEGILRGIYTLGR